MKPRNRADVYQPNPAEENPFAPGDPGSWVLVAGDVPCTIQMRRGSVKAGEAGQKVAADAEGYFPATTEIRVTCAVVVTSGPNAGTYLVDGVAERAGRWRTVAELTITGEIIAEAEEAQP